VRSFLGMPLTTVREIPTLPRPRRRRLRGRRSRRAVSDVVATILLLALTVTLFSAIFAFVTAFPSPPPQNSNQFQAALILSAGGTAIVGLNITHLAGPQVPANAQIFLHSAKEPSKCPFSGSVTVGSGLPAGSTVWNLGQVWSKYLTSWATGCSYSDPVPDNITVYIVSASVLIFSVILPGQQLIVSPTITATWTNPGSPSQGKAFQVLATISGPLGSNKPYVNLAGVPGQSAASVKMWFNSTSSHWQFNVTAGNTTSTPAGTYYGFVNVTGTNGATATAAVTVTITASASGGAAITLSPSTDPHTSSPASVKVTGTGFATSSSVSVSYNGVVIAPTGCTSGSISGDAITTTSSGGFVCTFSISSSVAGEFTFTASDYSSGQMASAIFSWT
jgi:hypothetical protein